MTACITFAINIKTKKSIVVITENPIQIYLSQDIDNLEGEQESQVWLINFFCVSVLLNLFLVVRSHKAFSPFFKKRKITRVLPYIKNDFRTQMKLLPLLKMKIETFYFTSTILFINSMPHD